MKTPRTTMFAIFASTILVFPACSSDSKDDAQGNPADGSVQRDGVVGNSDAAATIDAIGAPVPDANSVAVVDAAAPPSTVSYAADIQPIWNTYCIKCHGERKPYLTPGVSWQSLTSDSSPFCGAYVTAGDPSTSLVFIKTSHISPAGLSPQCLGPMPKKWMGTDTYLIDIDADAVQKIETWISEGALNN